MATFMIIQTIAQQFYDYSIHIKGYSPQTIRRYKYVIEKYCKYSCVTAIENVTAENIRSLFFYGRTDRHWSANTSIIFHKTLLVFFRWCIKQGYMSHNPLSDIEKPRLEQRLPKKLTKQDAFNLLEIVHNYPYDNTFLRYRNHALFSMFVFAGLRKSELLNLKVTDIDLENMAIFINQGKGRKDRLIPISPTLAEILVRYSVIRKKANKTCPEFFTSSTRNTGFTEDGLKHLIRNIQKSLGWTFSSHKLRHTFATLMIEGGCDIYSLSKMMGHSDIKTTTIYLHTSAEHLRTQINKHPLN